MRSDLCIRESDTHSWATFLPGYFFRAKETAPWTDCGKRRRLKRASDRTPPPNLVLNACNWLGCILLRSATRHFLAPSYPNSIRLTLLSRSAQLCWAWLRVLTLHYVWHKAHLQCTLTLQATQPTEMQSCIIKRSVPDLISYEMNIQQRIPDFKLQSPHFHLNPIRLLTPHEHTMSGRETPNLEVDNLVMPNFLKRCSLDRKSETWQAASSKYWVTCGGNFSVSYTVTTVFYSTPIQYSKLSLF